MIPCLVLLAAIALQVGLPVWAIIGAIVSGIVFQIAGDAFFRFDPETQTCRGLFRIHRCRKCGLEFDLPDDDKIIPVCPTCRKIVE